jgi:rubrerythrin
LHQDDFLFFFLLLIISRYRAQHEAEKEAAMKQFEAFKKAASVKQNKMKEEFDDKLQSMMEQSKAALKDFQDKTKSFADIIARLESQASGSSALERFPYACCLQGSSSMEEVKRAHKTEISELVRTSNAKYSVWSCMLLWLSK